MNSCIYWQDEQLMIEELSAQSLAERYGTPCYVYSRAQLEQHYLAYHHAFAAIDHQVCFAVKANSNLAVLNVLAQLGAGFDIVSIGELKRVLAAGGNASKVVFSGLGKSVDDIAFALTAGVACFNVESLAELERINDIANRQGKRAPVSLRVNPDVNAQTHPYISTGLKENKFGIPSSQVMVAYKRAAELNAIDVIGIDCHIGSQLTSTEPFIDALTKVAKMIDQLATMGIKLKHIDIGGGLGVCYQQETPPSPGEYAASLMPQLTQLGLKVFVEPGRSIAANAGVLLTRVDLLKPTPYKNFAIVDAAMNDMLRPALYGAWMDIQTVRQQTGNTQVWDVVGAVCETGDFLGKDRVLTLAEGDVLALFGAGAYGYVMSSQYNTRPRACEVMVDGAQSYLIKPRETLEQLWADERILPNKS